VSERLRSPALPETEPHPAKRADRLARELDAAFQARARLYWHLFDTIRAALGEAEAERLLSLAIERTGVEAGGRIFAGLTDTAPLAVATRFLTVASPDWGRLFPHEITREDEAVTVRVLRCPLKAAWVADGRSEAEIATLCRIAGRADHGVFGQSGCGFDAETWEPGREGCCVLRFGPDRAAA
jgi:hypothetical protein